MPVAIQPLFQNHSLITQKKNIIMKNSKNISTQCRHLSERKAIKDFAPKIVEI